MKKLGTFITALTILSFLLAPAAFAQMRMGGGGWGPGNQSARMYDLSTVETITGTVTSIDNQTAPGGGMSHGVHLRVQTASGSIPVYLGPDWYLDDQDMQIATGDSVEITGSRVAQSGGFAIIAAEVRQGDRVLTLRDQNGFPVWSARRRQ